MLKIQNLSAGLLTILAIISTNSFAQDNNEINTSDASYAIGVLMGTELQKLIDSQKEVINYDKKQLVIAIQDVLEGKVELTNNEKVINNLQAIDQKLKQASLEKQQKIESQNQSEGDKYRAEFAKKQGVKQTNSGLLYIVEKTGSGDLIKATDTVKVHYTGTLPNGEVFDSSIQRGQPAEFRLDQVIAGWTEGLQLIKKGGKIELVIPPELAYGKMGAGSAIPPNATLHFDVEVLDVISNKQ